MRRNTLAARARAAVAATVLLAAAPALAIDGHRPIHAGKDIIEPGYYKFTRNVASGGAPVITVSVGPEDRVVIDLNCFTATQLSTNVPVIQVSSGGNIVIKNGELQNGTNGIEAVTGFTGSLTVTDMKIGNAGANGIMASGLDNFEASNVNISQPGGDGINLSDLDEAFLRDILTRGAGDDGLEMFGLATSGRVEKFTAKDSGRHGLRFDGMDSISVMEATSVGSGSDGIHINQLSGGVFLRGHVSGSGRHGVNVIDSRSVRFGYINVRGSSGTGFIVDPNSEFVSLAGGSVFDNDKGIEINSDRTIVRGVEVTGNAQEGVHVTSLANDTVVRESTSVGNVVWDLLIEGLNVLTFGNVIGTTGP